MKIGIISDLHLGYRQYGLKDREQDFYDQYMKCIEAIIDLDCQLAIFAGDIFDNHKPSPIAISTFAEGLEKLNKNDIPVVNIVGNHTQLQVKDHFEPDKLFENKYNYHILDESHSFPIIGDIEIYGLPYYPNHSLDAFKEEVSKLNCFAKYSKYSILVIHQEFQEFCGFDGAHMSIYDLDINNFDCIICGHIHSRLEQVLDDCLFVQPGSIERMNTKEAEDEIVSGKGVTVLDISPIGISTTFVRIPNSRKIFLEEVVTSEDLEITNKKFQEIIDRVIPVDNPIVSLKVFDKNSQLSLCRDWEKKLSECSLMSRMRYIDERDVVTGKVDFVNDDLTPLGALKIAVKDWDDNEKKLAIDLFNKLSSKDKDIINSAKNIIDQFLESNY